MNVFFHVFFLLGGVFTLYVIGLVIGSIQKRKRQEADEEAADLAYKQERIDERQRYQDLLDRERQAQEDERRAAQERKRNAQEERRRRAEEYLQ